MPRPLLAQANELQRVMAELVRKYQFRDRNETVGYGLSVAQAYALRSLSEEGPLTMGVQGDDRELLEQAQIEVAHRKAMMEKAKKPNI